MKVDAYKLSILLEAAQPFIEMANETHKTDYNPELEDDDYISVYHNGIRAKHFRALKKAIEDLI